MSENYDDGDYYVRCPDCGFIESGISRRDAYSLQNNGCQTCDDNRSLAVAKMPSPE